MKKLPTSSPSHAGDVYVPNDGRRSVFGTGILKLFQTAWTRFLLEDPVSWSLWPELLAAFPAFHPDFRGRGPAENSIRIEAPLEKWREWTGQIFPDPGPYIIPGGAVPVTADTEWNIGLYIAPSIWVAHRVSSDDSPE